MTPSTTCSRSRCGSGGGPPPPDASERRGSNTPGRIRLLVQHFILVSYHTPTTGACNEPPLQDH